MKLHYYPETDSLYIDVSDAVSADSREVAEGVVIDFDAEGVTRRRLGSGLVEGAVSSETVYHVIIVK